MYSRVFYCANFSDLGLENGLIQNDDWPINFCSMRLRQLFAYDFFRTNSWLTVGIVILKVSITTRSWFPCLLESLLQLTSQCVAKFRFASALNCYISLYFVLAAPAWNWEQKGRSPLAHFLSSNFFQDTFWKNESVFPEKYCLQQISMIFPILKFFWFLQKTLNSGGKKTFPWNIILD